MEGQDYGFKIGGAFKAITQMYKDVRKILIDCDNYIEGDSIFSNTVTSSLSYSINNYLWASQGVFRYWLLENNIVKGATVAFYSEELEINQPLFIVGELNYIENNNIKEVCEHWDLWNAAFSWTDELRINEVVDLTTPEDEARIDTVKFYIKPLFEIENFNDAKKCFELVKF